MDEKKEKRLKKLEKFLKLYKTWHDKNATKISTKDFATLETPPDPPEGDPIKR